ncbi:MAG: ROK family transcriptional regulator [Chloroflexi bacterium]|nr:ROK family transcriptional regulator [Chloroflexota bacterium]
MRQSVNAGEMRKANRSLILNMIRKEGPISRNQIAHQLKLSVPTVLRIVEGLKNEDLVQEIRDKVVTRGHPQSLIELNSTGYAVVGIDLGGTKLYGSVTDLSGHIINEIYVPHHLDGAEKNLEQLCGAIQDLLTTPLSNGQKIRGLGIGVPAVTRFPEGVVVWAPSLHWRELPLKDILSRRFNLPVFVENDVNLSALGEMWFGGGINSRDFVCVSIGTGIGAGIIQDGALYRGYHFSAGEIGYITPGKQYLGKTYDKFGALEYLASGGGIAGLARQLIADGKIDSDLPEITAEAIFSEARRGIPWAIKMVDDMVDYLAIAMTAVVGLLDPEVIIINGGVSRSSDLLVEPLKKRLSGLLPFESKIICSELGNQATVLGAVMMVLDATTKNQSE